jgi:hypothetical protein
MNSGFGDILLVEESDLADLRKAFSIVFFAVPLAIGVFMLLFPMLGLTIDTTPFIGIALLFLGLGGLSKE